MGRTLSIGARKEQLEEIRLRLNKLIVASDETRRNVEEPLDPELHHDETDRANALFMYKHCKRLIAEARRRLGLIEAPLIETIVVLDYDKVVKHITQETRTDGIPVEAAIDSSLDCVLYLVTVADHALNLANENFCLA